LWVTYCLSIICTQTAEESYQAETRFEDEKEHRTTSEHHFGGEMPMQQAFTTNPVKLKRQVTFQMFLIVFAKYVFS